MNWSLLFLYLLYWILFGIIHTFLSSNNLKDKIPLGKLTYRIIYNVISILSFLLVLINVPSISSHLLLILDENGITFIISVVLIIFAIIIGVLGLLAWDILGFIGLRVEDNQLKTNGIYSFSRHPVYTSALIIFFVALLLEVNETSLSWFIGGGGYFILGSISEEIKLSKNFEEYNNYRKHVGRFFPWKLSHLINSN